MKITECMIAWTPRREIYLPRATYGQVMVGPWPDKTEWSRPYAMTVGACMSVTHEMTPWQRKAILFVEFNTMVVRDGIDPQVAHRALLEIEEYRHTISPDTEGATYPEDEA